MALSPLTGLRGLFLHESQRTRPLVIPISHSPKHAASRSSAAITAGPTAIPARFYDAVVPDLELIPATSNFQCAFCIGRAYDLADRTLHLPRCSCWVCGTFTCVDNHTSTPNIPSGRSCRYLYDGSFHEGWATLECARYLRPW